MSALNQLIRGKIYDFSSIECQIAGVTKFTSFQEINYTWSRDVGKLRGNASAVVKGRTRGEFDFEGSISMYKGDARQLEKILAGLGLGGFGEAEFDIVVTYFEVAAAVPIVDTLKGCALVNGENAHSRSPDPLLVSYDLDIIDILYDGVSPVSPQAGGGAGGLVP